VSRSIRSAVVVAVALLVVAPQEVVAEVALRIPPDAVDVVGVVLGVVVLDPQRRTVDPIVVGLSGLASSRPGEVDPLDAAGEDPVPRAMPPRRRGT
jgi:hypothetical protein